MLANRLSEDAFHRVLLLEAGGSDLHPFIRMPAAFSLPMKHPRFSWGFASELEPGLGGRQVDCPRGRVLGGSSSINGMVHVRGHPLDFERWQTMGAEGWGYADVLPYFKKAERALAAATDDPYRGRSGPLTVTRGKRSNPLYNAFLGACEQAGHALSDDLNGYRQEGFGDLEMTVDQGVRCSAARAYLAPSAGRPNLTVRARSSATRLRLEDDRAVGVEYQHRGQAHYAGARQGVLLSAGAIGSPQLLMLSGIGPADVLEPLGIDLHHELSGVGRNLMDHLEVYFQQACTRPVSLNRSLHPLGKGLIGARWLLSRSGAGATNHFEVGGFARSAPAVPWPDIQFHFLPAAVSYDGSTRARMHGFQAHVGPMLSPSRGDVRPRSVNPADPPLIRFNYLSHEDDLRVFRSAVRAAREIFAERSLDEYRGIELAPGSDVDSDAAIDAFVRQNAESAFHPCGTCRMGDGKDTVVANDCRVHGIEGLRVVDASVFPHITNGNLNAPTIMVAEKVADAIRGRQLAAEHQPYFTGETQST